MSIESTKSISSSGGPAVPVSTPGLQAGDRMNRIEFERRYNAMPDAGSIGHVGDAASVRMIFCH